MTRDCSALELLRKQHAAASGIERWLPPGCDRQRRLLALCVRASELEAHGSDEARRALADEISRECVAHAMGRPVGGER